MSHCVTSRAAAAWHQDWLSHSLREVSPAATEGWWPEAATDLAEPEMIAIRQLLLFFSLQQCMWPYIIVMKNAQPVAILIIL